jgi:catechol 2,3-dioxygenase-like lactoylglutathione lyase family enzyme
MNTTTLTDIRTVSIAVNDQDRSLEFYVDTLGFDKRMDATISGALRWVVPAMYTFRDIDSNTLYVVAAD